MTSPSLLYFVISSSFILMHSSEPCYFSKSSSFLILAYTVLLKNILVNYKLNHDNHKKLISSLNICIYSSCFGAVWIFTCFDGAYIIHIFIIARSMKYCLLFSFYFVSSLDNLLLESFFYHFAALSAL